MSAPILKTKLYVPPARPNRVRRERLIARLDGMLDCRGALVCAPAGFGKTTLMADWARECRHVVGWLSLDAADNDPARFWRHLEAALGHLLPGHSWATDAGSSLDSQERLVSLLNAWSEHPDPSVLILDDLHLVTERAVHRGLLFLLNHLPPGAHLVCGTRMDPPWPLARLRGRGELVEIRADRLRFTPDETADFCGSVLGRDLAAAEVLALDARIEGWIAGLQMAAISMRSHLDTEGEAGLEAFVGGFRRSRRFILDYLMGEVLDHQSKTMREFLLDTSILDLLSAPVCNAVAGVDDSAVRLDCLDRANLFVVPLDDDRRWFRYHHLFRELLRKCLEQERPGATRELHLRASRWFEGRRSVGDAVAHAMAADDVERVAGLMAGNALAIMGRGDLEDLTRWALNLPADVVQLRPWLRVSMAWVLAFGGKLSDAAQHLDVIESIQAREWAPSGLSGGQEEDDRIAVPGVHRMWGHAAAIRAYIAGQRGEMAPASEYAREALSLLPDSDVAAAGFAVSILGSVLRWRGELDAAERASRQAMALGRRVGANRVASDAFCDLAALQIVQGHLHAAASTCHDALQQADEDLQRNGRRLPITGFVHARLSAVLLEWDQLDAALYHARRGVELCEAWGWPDGLFFGHTHLARVLAATGDTIGALDVMARAEDVARGVSPFMLGLAQAEQARLNLEAGHFSRAVRWAERWAPHGGGSDPEADVLFSRLDEYLTSALVDVTRARQHPLRSIEARQWLGRALGTLDRLLSCVASCGAEGLVVHLLAHRATLYTHLGDREKALASLARALYLAEPEGYVRALTALGETMRQLLLDALAQGVASDYVERLLVAMGTGSSSETAADTDRATPLVEPLTPREMQVLRLLHSHLTGPQIAEHLTVSANTVRTHIKRIYDKLGVHSRDEAIERAQVLDFLA